jgi:proteasome lid subunit RPN8/RPN11
MKLNKDVIDKMYDHALIEYPDECCGIITGNDDTQIVHQCENIQNRLHAEDPLRFPRDARTAYFIDRTEFDRVISSSLVKGENVLALYHSHAEHEAYFSEEDAAAQTVFGEPEFPDALHVVISVMGGKIHDLKCFKWDRGNEIFYADECG